jgi:hypothetical protein
MLHRHTQQSKFIHIHCFKIYWGFVVIRYVRHGDIDAEMGEMKEEVYTYSFLEIRYIIYALGE